MNENEAEAEDEVHDPDDYPKHAGPAQRHYSASFFPSNVPKPRPRVETEAVAAPDESTSKKANTT